MRILSLLAAALCLAACSDGPTGTLPDPVDNVSEMVRFDPDSADPDLPDLTPEEKCESLWSRTLPTGGGLSHPAIGKQETLFVTAGEKLFAIDRFHNDDWVWPDDDANWIWPEVADDSVPPPWALHTPVVGREGAVLMGTSGAHILKVDRNGNGIFALPVEGNVTGAVAVTDDFRIIVQTDAGAVYAIQDETEYTWWKRTGDDKLPFPREGMQPVIGPAAKFGDDAALVLTWDSLYCFDAATGTQRWVYPLEDGLESTSNLMLDKEGNVYFVAGGTPTPPYYDDHFLVRVPPDGPEGATVLPVYSGKTRIVTISQGRLGFVLMGTENAGLMAYDLPSESLYWHFIPPLQNFERVAQPVQAADGLIYFGAARHWLYSATETGDAHWYRKLEGPEVDMGAILAPSSPLLMDDGAVIFHAGNQLHAIRCTDAGPAGLAWPRYGGNNRNDGNISAKLTEANEE